MRIKANRPEIKKFNDNLQRIQLDPKHAEKPIFSEDALDRILSAVYLDQMERENQ